jgi:hemerythrin-like domain-containing protein
MSGRRADGSHAVRNPAANRFMRRLHADHAGLSRVLREIDLQQSLLTVEPGPARAVLVEALDYLLGYQHGFHHPQEDRLFERIRLRDPRPRRDLGRLRREHRIGLRRAATLRRDLGRAAESSLHGRAGLALARRLGSYVSQTRDHMCREELVFHEWTESALDPADWDALVEGLPQADPMADARQFARQYPRLAAQFARAVRELGQPARSACTEPVDALRRGVEQLFELYGTLLHDAHELVLGSFGELREVSSPIGLLRAARPLPARTWQFASRCVSLPIGCVRDVIVDLGSSWRRRRPQDVPPTAGVARRR